MIKNNYYSLLREIKELRRNYNNLDIEDKIRLLNLEIKAEGKNIKGKREFVSKSVKKKIKHLNYLKNNKKKVSR